MLGIISLYSRPMPSPDCWMRMEMEVGRFNHQNLLVLSWVERLLTMEKDYKMSIYARIRKDILDKSPYLV